MSDTTIFQLESLKKRPRYLENLVKTLLTASAFLSVVVTLSILIALGMDASRFFTSQDPKVDLLGSVQPVSIIDQDVWLDWRKQVVEHPELVPVEIQKLSDEGKIDTERLIAALGESDQTPQWIFDGYSDVTVDRWVSGFFLGLMWQPQINRFGFYPLLNATLMTSFIAMLIAAPFGISVAIYLSEYAPPKVSNVIKPILEVLTGIPTIVYGFFALTVMTPGLVWIFGENNVETYNTLSAGLVMGVLIMPTIASMTEDALRAVPKSLKQAGYAMGGNKLEVALNITVPAAASGIAAALILGVSRAIGETMIVALAAGNAPKLTFNPLESAETMTGHIVRISGGDLSYDSIDYTSLFALSLMLFLMTFGLNLISQRIVERFREVYE